MRYKKELREEATKALKELRGLIEHINKVYEKRTGERPELWGEYYKTLKSARRKVFSTLPPKIRKLVRKKYFKKPK